MHGVTLSYRMNIYKGTNMPAEQSGHEHDKHSSDNADGTKNVYAELPHSYVEDVATAEVMATAGSDREENLVKLRQNVVDAVEQLPTVTINGVDMGRLSSSSTKESEAELFLAKRETDNVENRARVLHEEILRDEAALAEKRTRLDEMIKEG